jgi:putative tricarboxylic transport membrane protein
VGGFKSVIFSGVFQEVSLMLREKNFIGALVFLAFGLFGTFEGYRLKPGTLSAPGAGFFPFYLGIIVTILSFILLFKVFMVKLASKEDFFKIGGRWKRLLFALALFVAYVYALKPVGFLICSFVLLILLLRVVEGRSWKSTLIISVICTVLSYFVFAKYLGVPLPKGVIPF